MYSSFLTPCFRLPRHRLLFTLGSYLVGVVGAAAPLLAARPRSSFPFLSAPVFAIDLSSPLSFSDDFALVVN